MIKHSPIVREYSKEQLRRYELENSAKGAVFVLVLIFLSILMGACLILLLRV